MIQIVAAALIWLLVICLLPGIRVRRDHSVLTAAITISVALTLNIDQVYVGIDSVLGGRNFVDLLANVSMVVGIYFLSRAIIRAATPDETVEKRDSCWHDSLGRGDHGPCSQLQRHRHPGQFHSFHGGLR